MQYLCVKQLAAGGTVYYPGEVIPDSVILPERSAKLIKSGYLSELDMEMPYKSIHEQAEPGTYDGTIQIVMKGISEGENEQLTSVAAKADEIQQVFSIMQMSAEEGAKEITQVKSENVLVLLHAADSRKTIKNAAKEQADRLFSVLEGAGG